MPSLVFIILATSIWIIKAEIININPETIVWLMSLSLITLLYVRGGAQVSRILTFWVHNIQESLELAINNQLIYSGKKAEIQKNPILIVDVLQSITDQVRVQASTLVTLRSNFWTELFSMLKNQHKKSVLSLSHRGTKQIKRKKIIKRRKTK